jgi:hypothetical protein
MSHMWRQVSVLARAVCGLHAWRCSTGPSLKGVLRDNPLSALSAYLAQILLGQLPATWLRDATRGHDICMGCLLVIGICMHAFMHAFMHQLQWRNPEACKVFQRCLWHWSPDGWPHGQGNRPGVRAVSGAAVATVHHSMSWHAMAGLDWNAQLSRS